MMLLLCLSAFLVLVQSFPESESPVLGVPKLIVPPTRSCTIQILTAACSGYNQVTQAPFTFPKNCNKPDDWAQIVLHLHGAVQGVQFDRYGAFWINGLEVLRLTTPEPTQKGITWDVEKDVSDLKTYFKSNEKDLVSYLTIPNVVDSTYTGVLFVNITLTFYLANPSIGVEAIPDYQYLLPLTNAPIVSPDNPTAALTIAGTQKQTYDFSLNKIKEDIYMSDSLYAQVYASPHGCEEFYYTNVPNSASGSLGICGGGAYREILVEIDGIFANSIIPFPVVYTGGINPLLWRPLTGIMSFNIPAYVLDLSPFLGLLADGKTHNISVSVLNNDDQGYWLVDVGLLIKEGQQSDKKNDTNNRESTHKLLQKSSDNMIVKSTFDIYYDTGTQQTVNELQRIYKTDSGKRVPLFTFNTFASRRFYVKSTFMNANHRHLSRSVSNILSLNNTNNIAVNLMDSVDYTAQISNYKSVSTITTDDGFERQIGQLEVYPLNTTYSYTQDSTSFDISAYIKYSYNKWVGWSETSSSSKSALLNSRDSSTMSPPLILTWTNAMNSKASLNETTAIHSVSTGHGQTVEWYDVQNTVPTDSYCYDRNLSSFDGFIQSDMTKGSTSKCIYPQGLYFCEYDVCGEYTGSASAPIQKRTRRDADDSKTSLGDRVSFADGSYMFMPINNDVNPHTEVALSDVPMYGAVFKYSVSGIQDAVRDLSHGMDSSMRVTDNGKIDLSDLVSVSPSQRVSKQTATYDYTAISELLAANPKTQSITSKILKRINNAQTNNNGKSFINSHSLSIGRNSKSVYMNLNN